MSEAVNTPSKKERPEFRNIHFVKDLPYYRWPLASLASGAHRISGLLLLVLLPFALYLLEKSLTSETSFEFMKGIASHWLVKLVILATCWAYIQHFISGIRHLVMDLHIGLDKEAASKSGARVLIVVLALTALVALKLWGAF